jgi:hypothetical protein
MQMPAQEKEKVDYLMTSIKRGDCDLAVLFIDPSREH